MQWPEELLERAKKMFLNGDSHGTIARELSKEYPGLSRNAVIGELTRLGVTRSAPAKVVQAPAAQPLKPRPAPPPQVPVSRVAPQSSIPVREQVPVARANVAHGAKSILDLAWNECRYAIGEDEEGAHAFCAEPIRPGCSYCRHHAEICLTGHGLRKAERELERARA